MADKKDKKEQPEESEQARNKEEELQGFDIRLNEFGEVESSIRIDRLNAFLNENLPDKKLGNLDEEE